jgi:hypothetical protein
MAIYNEVSPNFTSQNLNALGSQYAQAGNHALSLLIQKTTNRTIFDADVKQFLELSLLNMNGVENVNNDEFFYKESGYQREPIVVTANSSAVTYPASQTISVQSMDTVSTNIIVAYPDGSKGTITAVNTANNTIEVTPYVGSSVPAITASSFLCNVSTVDADGAEGFATHFRMKTIERNQYIQEFNMAIRYNRMELFKMKNAGNTDNFLSMETKKMMDQHRIGLSNAFWTGQKGEVMTKNGLAKTTGGVYTSMVEAGSPRVDVTNSTFIEGFEEAVFASEFGEYGATRFAYMTPRMHRRISNNYKEEFTRYAPNDTVAALNLKSVDVGSSKIVLVPYRRFEDTASFPLGFDKKILILDHENIKRCQTWGEMSGVTNDLTKGEAKRYTDTWVETNMGIKFNNPLGCAEVNFLG